MKKEQEWLIRVAMNNFVEVGEYLYFFALNFNALYRMQKGNRELEYLGRVPNEKLYGRHLYGAITEFEGKIYLPPVCAEEIAIYDIINKSFTKVALKYSATGVYSKFFGVLSANGKICFIPARYEYLVIIDVKNERIDYVDAWRKMLDIPSQYTKLFVKNGYFSKNNKLYMASQIGDCLIKISLKSYDVEVVSIGNGTDGFMDMFPDEDGKHIWFIHKTNPEICKWNEENGELVVYNDFPDDFINEGEPFINILDNETHICAVAYQANMSIEINKETGVIKEAVWDTTPAESLFNNWKAKHYFGKSLSDKRWLIANIDDHSFYIVNNGIVEEKFYIEDRYAEARLLFGTNLVQEEKRYCDLRKYLEIVKGGL